MIDIEEKKENSATKMEEYRKNNGISYTFIAKKTMVTPTHVRDMLICKKPLTKNMHKKINELWGTDF